VPGGREGTGEEEKAITGQYNIVSFFLTIHFKLGKTFKNH